LSYVQDTIAAQQRRPAPVRPRRSADSGSSSPAWVDSALALQRSAGNAVTTSILRSGPPSIQLAKGGFLVEFFEMLYKAEEDAVRKKAGKGKLPKKWAGGMRAFAILSESFGDVKPMVAAKLEILSPAEMKTKYDGFYGKGSYKKDGPLEGFEKDGINYLNSSEQSVDTVIHESLHSQEHDDWDAMTYNDGMSVIGEGATEILTKIAATKSGRKPSTSYPEEAKLVQRMCKASSLSALKKAYFLGEGTFKTEVTAKLTGTWAQFKKKVTKGDLAGARGMIKIK
jgi:hypothetical protein